VVEKPGDADCHERGGKGHRPPTGMTPGVSHDTAGGNYPGQGAQGAEFYCHEEGYVVYRSGAEGLMKEDRLRQVNVAGANAEERMRRQQLEADLVEEQPLLD